jgi:transcriptional regulator with XRE-family HTH domain
VSGCLERRTIDHMAVAEAGVGLGDLLRYWRRVRGKSQFDLAMDAMTTPRYVSFVETGRSQPSRQMVVRLARALDVPLRDRNGLLLAAGYAPLYAAGSLDEPDLARVEAALASMLAQHEPFPAVVMDRAWNVLRANTGAQRLFGGLFAPDPLPEPANVLTLMIEPGPVRDAVLNWDVVVPALLERSRREAVGGVLDADTAARVERLRSRPDVAAVLSDAAVTSATVPVLDVRFAFEGAELSFFSVVSTIGTPIDITAQELRLEAFFAADEATRATWSGAPRGRT